MKLQCLCLRQLNLLLCLRELRLPLLRRLRKLALAGRRKLQWEGRRRHRSTARIRRGRGGGRRGRLLHRPHLRTKLLLLLLLQLRLLRHRLPPLCKLKLRHRLPPLRKLKLLLLHLRPRHRLHVVLHLLLRKLKLLHGLHFGVLHELRVELVFVCGERLRGRIVVAVERAYFAPAAAREAQTQVEVGPAARSPVQVEVGPAPHQTEVRHGQARIAVGDEGERGEGLPVLKLGGGDGGGCSGGLPLLLLGVQ